MKRRTVHGDPFDPTMFFTDDEDFEGYEEIEEPVEQVGPYWYVPGNGELPETSNFPPLWLDWFLGYYDDPKATPWETYDQYMSEGGPPEGMQLFYSPIMLDGRRVGWLEIPKPPLYGAHHLAGFKEVFRTVKERPEILKLHTLRWVRFEIAEEAIFFDRRIGNNVRVRVPGRPALQGVWPNVLCVDAKDSELLAMPYTSNVGYGDDLELVQGAPPYPLHLPSRGMNVVDIRFRANRWKDRPHPLNDGGFWMYTIDGEVTHASESASYTQSSLASELDQAKTFNERNSILRKKLGLGSTTSIAVLRLREAVDNTPGAYLVISCQYPAFTLFATGYLGPNDKFTLSYSKKVIIAVLKNALPGIRALDLERRPLSKMNPPSTLTTPDVSMWVGFKRSVICALENWRAGGQYGPGAGDSGEAHLRRELQNNKRVRFQVRGSGAATATQAVDVLIFDKAQARSAVILLANGWEQQFYPIYETWIDPEFSSPFDAALRYLASLLQPNPANPSFGVPANDPRWDTEPELLLNIRDRVLAQLRYGLKDSALDSLWAWEEMCRWQSPDDPGVDCTLMHWMIFLSFAMCASQLPLVSVENMRSR